MTAAAPETSLLRIDALSKNFGGFVALDNIGVEIRKGERFGLIGPNGSGKTTLVNCISGALRPNKGAVLFAGEDITQMPPNQRSHDGAREPDGGARFCRAPASVRDGGASAR
jgi:branched-chain amino acid transport system ATP-binding protein